MHVDEYKMLAVFCLVLQLKHPRKLMYKSMHLISRYLYHIYQLYFAMLDIYNNNSYVYMNKNQVNTHEQLYHLNHNHMVSFHYL